MIGAKIPKNSLFNFENEINDSVNLRDYNATVAFLMYD